MIIKFVPLGKVNPPKSLKLIKPGVTFTCDYLGDQNIPAGEILMKLTSDDVANLTTHGLHVCTPATVVHNYVERRHELLILD